MELDAAIFDFGGVLTSSIRASFLEFERALSLPEGALLDAFRHQPEEQEPAFALLEKGLISEGEFYARMFTRLREYTGMEVVVPEEPAAIREKMFGSLQRNEEMIGTLARIAAAGYKTAILTNNVKEWTGWREMVDAHVVDLVIDSSAVGMRKPEPEIYALTCARLGVMPARAAFVDDIPVNVQAAASVGMRAIRFTTTEDVLDELRPLFPRAFETSRESAHA